MLRKVEAYLLPTKVEAIQDLLVRLGVEGMSFTTCQGYGTRSPRRNGRPEFEERVKVEIVVDETRVEELTTGLRRLAVEGRISGGMVFVVPVEDAVRLATREAGKSALI
jgi:nitrogen regulatory protein P-II 1